MTDSPLPWDLSVVVPAHNAQHVLAPLVDSLLSTELQVQVIIVDDASTDDTAQLVDELADNPAVEGIHHAANRGAGIARNTGFAAADGRYTLFFDADDIIDPGVLAHVVRRMDETGVDVGFTPYSYVRAGASLVETMNRFDIDVWQDYVGTAPEREVSLTGVARLLGFTNYPWNKVLRTRTYQDAGLRFSGTPVHNDILGHWHSLLAADRILLVNQILCKHVVGATTSNLTNRHDGRRLALFEALDETYDLLASSPLQRQRYAHHYWSMVDRVGAWAYDKIEPAHHLEFNRLMRELLQRIDLADLMSMRRRHDPALATRLVARAAA